MGGCIHMILLLMAVSLAMAGDAVPFYRYWNGKDHFYTTNADEIGTTTKGLLGKHSYTSEGTQCNIYSSQVAGSKPLYRYYNGKDHFYTQSTAEIGTIVPGVTGKHGYKSEGVAGYCYPKEEAGTVPLYRYYGNGDHFYTTNAEEIGTIVAGTVGRNSYKSEGIVCYVIPAQDFEFVNLYRYYNGKDHFYTTNINEIGTGTSGQVGKYNHKSEGVQCKVASAQAPGTRPLYRYYGNGEHFYTMNAAEIGTTVPGTKGKANYLSEGIVGYCYPTARQDTVPLYRYYKSPDHFYTTNADEIGVTTPGFTGKHGYMSEGITCHVLPVQ